MDAAGERTDLALGEPLVITSDVSSSAQGLVLTEWKIVRNRGDTKAQADQALTQARRYSAGVLAGFELTSMRYLVLVSDDHLTLPPDVIGGGVTFRHINIAVAPSKPSKA